MQNLSGYLVVSALPAGHVWSMLERACKLQQHWCWPADALPRHHWRELAMLANGLHGDRRLHIDTEGEWHQPHPILMGRMDLTGLMLQDLWDVTGELTPS